MSLRADHKALVFLGAVAVLGAGVRVSRAASGSPPPAASQQALDRQMASADSAANSGSASSASHRAGGRAGAGRGRGTRRPGRSSAFASDSAHAIAQRDSGQGTPSRRRQAGPLDRPGYINGRLDLDVATAAQIDSLPGVTPALAQRIAADRMKRGPFLSLDGLRRVSGIGPTLAKRLDTLVTFSGAFVQGSPQDSLVPPRRAKTRRSTSTRPVALRTQARPQALWRLGVSGMYSLVPALAGSQRPTA
jgi:Helix-hairpin-helix motif